MRVFIDATMISAETADLRVFGMSLLERHLHSLRRSLLEPTEIVIAVTSAADEVEPTHPARSPVHPRAFETLTVRWSGGTTALGERLAREAEAAGDTPWLVLSAQDVIDARLVEQMAQRDDNVFFTLPAGDDTGFETGAVLRLSAGQASALPATADSLAALIAGMQAAKTARPLDDAEFDSYIKKLRRHFDPYALRVADDATRRRVERFLFWSNYKGSTDFLTKYVWPPFVWVMVRPLARWRVHPNWVTTVDIVATIAAIPLWMNGWWATGFFCAYLMSVLDSVDGKLARLTYTYSKLGNVLDHGLDLVHPPFWYLAWAWYLGGADPESDVFRASVWMFWLYVGDRICAPIFKRRTGRSIHGYLPVDVKIRTFISRRNVNLPFFTAAVAIDVLNQATPFFGNPASEPWALSIGVFYFIVAWQAVCLVYHAWRTVQFFNVKKSGQPLPAPS